MEQNRTIGFVISHKENEKRRALLPSDIETVKNKSALFFENGYGEVLGIPDSEYQKLGCRIASRKEVLQQEIICDPKIGEANYVTELSDQQGLFGWIHFESNQKQLGFLRKQGMQMCAWEKMFNGERHCFWRNNQLAGEAAIIHAYLLTGQMPYETRAAVIGRGNTAQGACRILEKMGARITIYNRDQEKLFRKELYDYDVIVMAVAWDTKRTDHLIYEKDLLKMRKNTLLIDISCDAHGAIETSVPTTTAEPTYMKHGVIHYALDHTPSLVYKTSSKSISAVIRNYVDDLIEGKKNVILEEALV